MPLIVSCIGINRLMSHSRRPTNAMMMTTVTSGMRCSPIEVLQPLEYQREIDLSIHIQQRNQFNPGFPRLASYLARLTIIFSWVWSKKLRRYSPGMPWKFCTKGSETNSRNSAEHSFDCRMTQKTIIACHSAKVFFWGNSERTSRGEGPVSRSLPSRYARVVQRASGEAGHHGYSRQVWKTGAEIPVCG